MEPKFKYKAFLKQSDEGCGWTIGCAQKLVDIEADSIEQASEKLIQIITENYSHPEFRLMSAELFEVERVSDIDVKTLYNLIDNHTSDVEKQKQEALELAEYIRLSQKFGRK